MGEKRNDWTALWLVPLTAAALAGALTLGIYAWERFTRDTLTRTEAVSGADFSAAEPEGNFPSAKEYSGDYAQAGAPSPRFRYQEAREKCTYNTHSSCRKETLANGESVEIIQFPTFALVLTRIDAQGRGYERLGVGPKDNIQYFSQKDRTWFFDDNGRVSQLTAAAPGARGTDVIHYAPDGSFTDCYCSDGTADCCSKPEYDLAGKPNTYCTMFPQDSRVCASYCVLFPGQCGRVQ